LKAITESTVSWEGYYHNIKLILELRKARDLIRELPLIFSERYGKLKLDQHFHGCINDFIKRLVEDVEGALHKEDIH
jgi:hypothetical protein